MKLEDIIAEQNKDTLYGSTYIRYLELSKSWRWKVARWLLMDGVGSYCLMV